MKALVASGAVPSSSRSWVSAVCARCHGVLLQLCSVQAVGTKLRGIGAV